VTGRLWRRCLPRSDCRRRSATLADGQCHVSELCPALAKSPSDDPSRNNQGVDVMAPRLIWNERAEGRGRADLGSAKAPEMP
jgi:hypothetical protein